MFFRNKADAKASPRKSNTKRLSLESLEGRQMMAGDVIASLFNGDLYVSEVPQQVGQDNGIRISKLANGKVQVLGTVANGTNPVASKVNGLAAQEFTVNGSLFVSLGAGNDRVQIGYDGGASAPSFNRMQIDVGAPPLVVASSINKGVLDIFTPQDSDQVLLWGANTRSSLSINTGVKNDWVYMGQVNVGDGVGVDNLAINTGSGPDQVTLKGTNIRGNLDIQTYSSIAEADQDGVFIDAAFDPSYVDLYRPTIVNGGTDIRTGGGADSLLVSDPARGDLNQFWTVWQTHGYVSMDTGAGNDTLLVRSAKIGEPTYDDVGLDNLVVNTGAGADNARFHNVNIGATFQLQMFASVLEADIDIASIDHLYAERDISILTGGGDDQVTLDNATAYWNLNVDTSSGNDRLDLLDYVLSLKNTNLFGGEGTDRLTYRSNNFLHNLKKTGWEYVNGIPQKLVVTTLGTTGVTVGKKA
jgi:hypothetical protein